ncbi:MAG TPA: NAD-dependent epimerase/dehydratase family protein [Caulobacteraceae bacterium]|jgi:UDP-glucuronate 4-epimerase|nr:NAD-dependent epimerase/dehydratase family protein [Caulobacteraceae bacterium]
MKRVLITGSAGFIGFHLAKRFLDEGWRVFGVDGFTPYYDVDLKRARHALLQACERFSGHELMLEDADALMTLTAEARPDLMLHLAAQAGVRYSVENPRAYADANLVGTFNLLEAARVVGVGHLLAASTSSVYGANPTIPFKEDDRTAFPLSLYAATKAATETMAHSYSHLWNLPTTMFRFFTVYGPWGRPDMALYKFVRSMLRDEPIEVFNHGRMARDFTFIDDLVEAVRRLADAPPIPGGLGASPAAPWRVVNIGRGEPVGLMDFIGEIERCLGRKARLRLLPMQPGDVERTFADCALLAELTGYRPSTSVKDGVAAFCRWYESYYGVSASS